MYGDFRAAGAELIVVSPERHEVTGALAAKHGLAFPIVRDEGLAIARAFGLVFTLPDDLTAIYQGFGIDLPRDTGRSDWSLPMPARFVISGGGRVLAADVDPDYTVRSDPEATLQVLRSPGLKMGV